MNYTRRIGAPGALLVVFLMVLVAAIGFAGGAAESGAGEDHGAEHEEHLDEHHDEDHESDEHGDDHDHESDDHDDHDHESDDHDHADGIPHIDPIVLADGESLSIVATTNIVGDVVRVIAGDDHEVLVLMALGDNPHSYEPTPSALRTLERAHIVFTNGLALEENLIDDLDAVAGGYVVPVSAGIEPLAGGEHSHDDEDHDDHDDHDHDDHHDDEGEHDDHDHDHDHVHAEGDPHVWTDPNNAIVWVENIVTAMSEADPENADVYRRRGDDYIAELEEVDIFIRQTIREVPRSQRKIVVDHEAFGYFADEYGLEAVGAIVPSTTDTAEPSARDIARLVDLIREAEVQAILVGRTASRALTRLAQTIADEVGRPIRIVPMLTGSLAPAGEPGDTYLGFLRYNAEQIAFALSGE